jgi:carbon-monoxide dehydrogenase large subunit
MVLRSPLAHGLVNGVDVAKALMLPGVAVVITAGDLGPRVPRIPVRLFPIPEVEPFEQPVIADGRVRYVGEPLAMVIAASPAIAEDALEAIAVDLKPLPCAIDAHEPQDGTAALFDGHPSNVAVVYQARKGNVADAFAGADYVRKERMYVQRHTGIPLEPRGLLARWDEKTGRMILRGAAKVPFANRRILARLLELEEDDIEVWEGDTGGGFGIRGEFFPEDFLVPFAARKLGRPVKWIEDRHEHFASTSHARDVACELEVACRRDGTILAMRGVATVDIGAYVRTAGLITPRNVCQFMSGPYRAPHVEMTVRARLSNKSPSGTYRGPGRYEADFFRERLFDIIAAELDIDRVAFRRMNLVSAGEMPYEMPAIAPAPSATSLDSGDYAFVLDRCLALAHWDEKRKLAGHKVDGVYHGLAVGCFIEGGAAGPSENAKLFLQPDGSLVVHAGSSAVGQGIETALGQIAADAMDLPFERVSVRLGSTPLLTEGWGSYHSRSTVMGGSAIVTAARELKDSMKKAAALQLNCDADSVELRDGHAHGPDGRKLSYGALAALCPPVEARFVNHHHTYAYGTHVAHVAVDPTTGRVMVIDYVAIEDAGRVVNPLVLDGQVVGAVVQGLGGAMMEELAYGADGQLLVGSFADYLMPVAGSFPDIRAQTLGIHPSPFNPLGAKGAGEGGVIPAGGLIANAVASALASLGVEPLELPLSPLRIARLVNEAGGRRTR